MRNLFFIAFTLMQQLCCGQDFNGRIHASILLDHLLVDKIPTYAEAYRVPFDMQAGNVGNKATPALSFELGYQLQKKWQKAIEFYSGLSAGYRQAKLSYQNRLEYYLKVSNKGVTQNFFSVDIERSFITIQIPVGIIFRVSNHLSLDLSARNNMLFPVAVKQQVRDLYFQFHLDNLNMRPSNKYLLEAAVGVGYSWQHCSLYLRYIQGITSIYPDTETAYEELIPSKLFTSSLQLSVALDIKKLFGDRKR